MDDNILDILGLQLVDYFITQQNYCPFNVPKELKTHIKKNEVYLTNKDSDTYHIIKIIKIVKEHNYNSHHLKNKNEIFDFLHQELIASGVKNVRFLIIILNDENQNENRMSPAFDVIIATSDKIINELVKFYPSISKSIKIDLPQIDSESNNQVDNNNNSENKTLSDSWKKVNFQNRRYLSDTLKKCSNANLVATWFLFIIPIITAVICFLVFGLSNDRWLMLDANLQHLIFGANYHNLIFGAHQYWRWLLYPFAGDDINITFPINLIFALWMFYRVGRFVEGFYGWWKAIIIWVGAMVLTGILQSVVDIYNIMSGFSVFALISLGAMLPFIWNYKLFKTPIMSRFFITIAIMLVFWYINNRTIITLIHWIIAFATGWLFATLVGYHNRKISVLYAFNPIALGGMLLFSGLTLVLGKYYHFDDNGYTLKVLQHYGKIGLISQDTIRSIMLNYFNIAI